MANTGSHKKTMKAAGVFDMTAWSADQSYSPLTSTIVSESTIPTAYSTITVNIPANNAIISLNINATLDLINALTINKDR